MFVLTTIFLQNRQQKLAEKFSATQKKTLKKNVLTNGAVTSVAAHLNNLSGGTQARRYCVTATVSNSGLAQCGRMCKAFANLRSFCGGRFSFCKSLINTYLYINISADSVS